MDAAVIDDQMDIQIFWNIVINVAQKLKKFLVAVTGFALCKDLA